MLKDPEKIAAAIACWAWSSVIMAAGGAPAGAVDVPPIAAMKAAIEEKDADESEDSE